MNKDKWVRCDVGIPPELEERLLELQEMLDFDREEVINLLLGFGLLASEVVPESEKIEIRKGLISLLLDSPNLRQFIPLMK